MASPDYTFVSLAPHFLDRINAAKHCGLSVSTMEKEIREGNFPKPRQLARRRVGWPLPELDAWCADRPVSELPPPSNTGSRRGKTRSALQALRA